MRLTSLAELQPGHYVTYLANCSTHGICRRIGQITGFAPNSDLEVQLTHPDHYLGRIPNFFAIPHDEAFTDLQDIYNLYPEEFI